MHIRSHVLLVIREAQSRGHGLGGRWRRSQQVSDDRSSFQSQVCYLEQCRRHTMPGRGQRRLPTLCSGVFFPTIYRRCRATPSCCVKETSTSGFSLFFPISIYLRYSINVMCTAQVGSCQHFPFRLLFPGDGNLIATFVLGSNRPKRGLGAKASSTHLKTTATATHSLCDQFKVMEVDTKNTDILNSRRWRVLFWQHCEVHGCRSARVHSQVSQHGRRSCQPSSQVLLLGKMGNCCLLASPLCWEWTSEEGRSRSAPLRWEPAGWAKSSEGKWKMHYC